MKREAKPFKKWFFIDKGAVVASTAILIMFFVGFLGYSETPWVAFGWQLFFAGIQTLIIFKQKQKWKRLYGKK